MKRVLRLVVSFLLIVLQLHTIGLIGPTAAHAAPQDVTDIQQGLELFETFSEDLAKAGPLAQDLALLKFTVGGSGGLGFADLFKKTVSDPAQTATDFSDFEGKIESGGSGTFGDRTVTVDVTPGSSGGVESLGVQIHVVVHTDGAGLKIQSDSPKVTIQSNSGVHVDIDATLGFTFDYVVASRFFYLVRDGTTPSLSAGVTASIPTPSALDAAAGILGIDVTASTFSLQEHLTGTLTDPNGDGKLAFTEPSSGGPVDGELKTSADASALAQIGFDGSQTNALSGSLTLTSKSIAGLTPITASVAVSDPDLSDQNAPTVTPQGFDTTFSLFQNASIPDLAGAIAQLTVAIDTIQRAHTADGGNVNLPFMQGSIADAVIGTDALRKFLKKYVYPTDPNDPGYPTSNPDLAGQPKFSTIQEFVTDIEDSSLLPGVDVTVASPSFDPNAKKFSFDLEMKKSTGSAQDLDPGAGQQNDPLTGAVRLGDVLKQDTGIQAVNAADALAKVTQTFDLTLTMVIDLEPAKTGSDCSPDPCPYPVPEPDNSQHVVQEQPETPNRYMIRTGSQLMSADFPIHTAVDATGAVGFLGIDVGGTLDVASTGANMLTVDLKSLTTPQGDGDIPIPAVFDALSKAGAYQGTVKVDDLLDVGVNAKVDASLTVSVPDASSFFPTPPSITLSMGDITDPTNVNVSATGLDKLADFDFGGVSDPQALRGKITDALTGLAAALDGGTGLGTALGGKLPIAGVSLGDLIDAHSLKDAVTSLSTDPPDTLELLIKRLNKKLDTDGAVTISIDTSSTPADLDLETHLTPGISRDVPLTLAGSGVNFVQSSGNIHLSGSLDADVKVAIPLDSTAVDPTKFEIAPGSSVKLDAEASLSGASLSVNAGTFSVALGQPGGPDYAEGSLKFVATLDDQVDTTGPVDLPTWLGNATLGISQDSNDAVTCPSGLSGSNLAACFKFPLYVGGTQVDPSDNDLTITVPQSDLTNPTVHVPSALLSQIAAELLKLADFSGGIEDYLNLAVNALDTAESLGAGKLPLVGDALTQLDGVLHQVRDALKTAFGGLAPSASDAASAVQTQINTAVTSAISGISGLTVTPTVTLDCGGSPCAGGDTFGSVTGATVEIKLSQGTIGPDGCTANCVGDDIPLDLGVPGLSIKAAGDQTKQLGVHLGWSLDVTFGLDKQKGFSIGTSGTEFHAGLSVSVPNHIWANIAFLGVNLTDTHSGGSGFNGDFGLDLVNPASPGDPLYLNDLASASPTDLLQFSLKGGVAIDWDFDISPAISGYVDPGASTQPGDPLLPGITGHFGLDWQFSAFTADPDSHGGDLDISFTKVQLDLGSALKKVLKPIADEIGQFTTPFKPIIDTLYAPIPLLSDLSHLAGGGDITLVDLAKAFSTIEGGPSLDFVDNVKKLVDIVNLFQNALASGAIDLGSFDLKGDQALQDNPTPDQAGDLITNETDEDVMSEIQGQSQDAADAIDSAENKDTPGVQGGFEFPILQPSNIFQMLLGKDVTLVHYRTGPLSLEFSYSQIFGPVYAPPPVFVTLGGAAGVSANFSAGLDTSGIRKAFQSGDALDILNGFFVDDFQDGKDVPELSFFGELSAGAEVSVAVISVGVDGKIRLTLNLDLNDPDLDGKMYFEEFKDALANPLCLFKPAGNLSFILTVFVTIGIDPFSTSFSFDLVNITLLDLSLGCPTSTPTLFHIDASHHLLVVNMGVYAAQRGSGWSGSNFKDEKVTVRELHDKTTHDFLGFSVSLFGVEQQALDNTLVGVVVDATGYSQGKETVALVGDGDPTGGPNAGHPDATNTTDPFDKIAFVLGGANDDTVLTGQGPSYVDGGQGNDNIATGGGQDMVAGGGGNDVITTGSGDDHVMGDGSMTPDYTTPSNSSVSDSTPGGNEGNDNIDLGLGSDVANGGPGDDSIDGGANDARATLASPDCMPELPTCFDGNDTIVGGTGGDHLNGAFGNDTIYGDEEVALGANDAGLNTGGDDIVDAGPGIDVVYGGDGKDTIQGQSDAGAGTKDTLYGNGGDDTMQGGSGDDKLYGGPDDDSIDGRSGDDSIFGGSGNDDLVGDLGADHIEGGPDTDAIVGDQGHVDRGLAFPPVSAPSAGDSVDTILGNAGDDFIDGGGGDDVIAGDDGSADCPAAGSATTEWVAPDESLVTGNDGVDTIHGNGGADHIMGDGAGDFLYGDAGGDFVCGSAGIDHMRGGTETDHLWGGGDGDFIYGDDGDDRAYGNDGADQLFGGSGTDHLEGNDDADQLFGEAGDDRLIGGSSTAAEPDKGDPFLYGGQGSDVVVGDNGTISEDGQTVHVFDLSGPSSAGGGDTILGGTESDLAFGGLDDDTIYGGVADFLPDAADHLEGNAGADSIHGQGSDDDILGGTSPLALGGGGAITSTSPDAGDTLLSGGDGFDTIVGDNGSITETGQAAPDGAPVRTVLLRDILSIGGGDTIDGDANDDDIYGERGGDTISGGTGDDYVEGNDGADTVRGDAGQDDILGGTSPRALGGAATSTVPDVGDTLLAGGDNADVLLGDNGSIERPVSGGQWQTSQADGSTIRTVVMLDRDSTGGGDTMTGDAGNDRMWGELGNDVMDGGADTDFMEGNQDVDTMSGGTGSDDMLGGTSPVALPDHSQTAAAGEPDGGDFMFGHGTNQTTNLADDDFMLGDNGVIDRCASGGRDACAWSVENLGTDPSNAPYGTPAVRFVTLLGESNSSTNHDGNDTMQGNSDADRLYGENGDDFMHGNGGVDRMWGGYGNDLMYGDAGVDSMLGDRGNVTTVPLNGTPPQETVKTSPPNLLETIYVPHTLWFKVLLLDQTSGGNDRMFGGAGNDAIHGGAGMDFIEGDDGFQLQGTTPATGNDLLFGDDGQDSIEGGPGHDHLWGGLNEDDLDVIRGTVAAPKVPSAPLYPTIASYAADFPGTYTLDPGAQGDDIVYGGHGRDIMQADTLADRLDDSNGAYNLYYVCPSAYGGKQITRSLSPSIIAFFQKVGEADGAIGAALAVTDPSATGAGEVSIVYPSEATEDNAGSAYPNTAGHFTCNS